MTPCPACTGPLGDLPPSDSARIALCVWCGSALVLEAGAVRLLTDREFATMAPHVRGKLEHVQNAARLYGAARRN